MIETRYDIRMEKFLEQTQHLCNEATTSNFKLVSYVFGLAEVEYAIFSATKIICTKQNIARIALKREKITRQIR